MCADWREQTLIIFSWLNISSVFNYECLYAQDNCLFDLQKTNKTETNKHQTDKQKRKNRLFKWYHVSFIGCLSLVHAVFLEHSNAYAVCLETEEKSTWEPKLLSTVVPLFLNKGKSAVSPGTWLRNKNHNI